MNTEIKTFTNEEFGNVRTVVIDEEPWFVGKDVAKILGYSNINKAVQMHVDGEDTKTLDFKGFSQNGSTAALWSGNDFSNKTLINESGLYSLIISSKLPNAKKFKHWVTREVIPSIRKHGAYMTPETIKKAITTPDFVIQLATELKNEQTKNKELSADVERMRPKEVFADAVATSHTSILVGELAKILKGNGIEIGQNRLFQWLRDNGFLIKRKGPDYNMPTQYAMERKLFEIKEGYCVNNAGAVIITKTTKVTGKGQQYFVNRFLKNTVRG